MDFIVGQSIRSTAAFRAVDTLVLTDPTTIKFKVRSPAGVETSKTFGVDVEVVKIGVGRYRCDFTATSSGDWIVRWTGEGALVTAGEETVPVEASAFTTP